MYEVECLEGLISCAGVGVDPEEHVEGGGGGDVGVFAGGEERGGD